MKRVNIEKAKDFEICIGCKMTILPDRFVLGILVGDIKIHICHQCLKERLNELERK